MADMQRLLVVKNPLPKTSQGVENANATLALYEAAGLYTQERYPELLQRVAKINRKAGNSDRAEELELLAARVTIAILGRYPRKSEEELPAMGLAQDLWSHVLSQPDPIQRRQMIALAKQVYEDLKVQEQKQEGVE